MPMIQGTQVTVEELLDAVAKLSPVGQARFERAFKALHQRKVSLKEKVARCAESYKLLPKQQGRLRELLDKNKEGLITPEEGKELDTLLEELDRRNLLLADEMQKLAHQEVHETEVDAVASERSNHEPCEAIPVERSEQDDSAGMSKQGEIS